MRKNVDTYLSKIQEIIDVAKSKNLIPSKPKGQPDFSDIALVDEVKIKKFIKIISENNKNYECISHILFMGLCGFVVHPDEDIVTKIYLIHGVLDFLHENKFFIIQKYDDNDVFSYDFKIRHFHIGYDFFTDIYYPILASRMFEYNFPREGIQASWLPPEESINRIILACRVMHYAKIELGDRDKFLPISQNRLVNTIARFPGNAVRSTFLASWNEYKAVLALLYAASTIHHKKKSLLASILSGEVCAADYFSYADDWLGRAKYFCDYVIADLKITGLHKMNNDPLKPVKPISFKPQPFSSGEKEAIESEFSRKKSASK